ncbi:MAG: FtsX-like permease family protein [bacterium]
MNVWHLIKRNLRFYWRPHIGVVLGAAVSTAVLTGALLVGDSVRFSLEAMALSRLGETRVALDGENRFFRTNLAEDLSKTLDAPVAPALRLRGLIIHPESDRRSSSVQVLGVDRRFWQMGRSQNPFTGGDDEIVLNEPLARRLEVKTGDKIVLRVEKPFLLSPEAPLSLDSDSSVARPMTVKAVVSDEEFGRFNLQPNQRSPLNAFVSLGRLGEEVDIALKSNLLLAGEGRTVEINPESAQEALEQCFRLEDVALTVHELPEQGQLELKSQCVFLNPEVERAAARLSPGAIGVLSYFVNSLEKDQKQTPYSIVTALGMLESGDPPILPPDMKSDEIVINEWLAEDLSVGEGDTIKLSYFVMGRARNLVEQHAEFRVRSILPMEGPATDPGWMPEFPGLSEKDSCRDWDPGMEIDLSRIRPKDEAYWDKFRGAPKAFVTLEAGQSMWSNRFGGLTAVRWPKGQGAIQSIEENLRADLNLPSLGLLFQPVREQALEASSHALDFGPLFLGLSFFLVVAALVLMGLLFALGMEQRTRDAGTLLALGFPWKMVFKILLLEGIVLAAGGALLGVMASIYYTRLMIYGLGTLWRDAVAGSPVVYHAEGLSLVVGWTAGVCMAGLAMWAVLRKHACQEIRNLLEDIGDLAPLKKGRGKAGFLLAVISAVFAGLVLLIPMLSGKGSGAGPFFGAGVLLLIASMGLTHGLLFRRAAASHSVLLSMAGLGLRNASRKRGRSLGVVAVLACASFLVFSVSANLKNPLENADQPGSGTGGFALIGESALPVLYDLNTETGQTNLGLDEQVMKNIKVVQIRVREGGDASCLNLNRVLRPQLLGVSPEALTARKAFTFIDTLNERKEEPWSLLKEELASGCVPAVGDQATILWGLGKKLGDTIEYVDEKGRKFEVQLIGALKNSILQGTLLIAEDRFIERFPSEPGYRMFLVDAPRANRETVLRTLERAGRNVGLEITPAAERLAEFYAVEKTYLSIFQILGSMGMMLGCVGLAFVVLRNVMERRSELALLQAVGFTRASLGKLILLEHGWLLAMGMACGVVSAGIAVTPALRSLGSDLPWVTLGSTLAAIMVSGVAWIWIASRLATGKSFLAALRNE